MTVAKESTLHMSISEIWHISWHCKALLHHYNQIIFSGYNDLQNPCILLIILLISVLINYMDHMADVVINSTAIIMQH